MYNLLINPIFRREFRAHARCPKTILFIGMALAVLTLIILALWPRSGIFSETNSNELFTVFLGAELALMILLTPAFTATSITSERENSSFDVLFTSLLTPTEIMFGKLCASLGMALLFVAVSLPVTAVCALSGGISLPTLLRAYAVIVVATVTYGLLGLAMSAVCHRSYTSLVATYLGIIGLAGATWLPAALFSYLPMFKPLFQALRSLSPFEALFALRYAERYELVVGIASAEQIFHVYLGGMAVLAALFFVLFSLFIFKPPRRHQAVTRTLYDDTRTALRRKLGFPFYLIDPLRRKKAIARWRNPVFVAEIRSKLFGNPRFIIRSLFTCIVVSLILLILTAHQYATMIDADRIRVVAIIFQLGVVALLAPTVSSGSITDETNSGTLLMLRMTPLSPSRVVIGKMKASLLYVMIFLISSLPVLLSLAYLESEAAYWRIGAWLAVLVLATTALTAGGLCASTLAATTGAATAVSYGFCIALCVCTLGVLLLGDRVSPAIETAILTFNPIVAALQITSDRLFADQVTLFGNKLWQNHLIAMAATTVLLLAVSSLRVRRLFTQRD
jgi:ABC-type transport system involved in multi-copper enzyme maturation permease subunit